MCLAALAIGHSPRFPLVLASNRDEFFARATQPLAWWQPAGHAMAVLSGQDLAGGGTWLGLNARGRLALVTNVREPGRHLAEAPSRGELVLSCLAVEDLDLLELARVPRNGFNLVTLDLARVAADPSSRALGSWVSNRPVVQNQRLGSGLFGLSNAALQTPWPKVQQLKQALAAAVDRSHVHQDVEALLAELFVALSNRQPAADADLPTTGVGLDRERQLSSAFIRIPGSGAPSYGTRCSTVVVLEQAGALCTVHVVEQGFGEDGAAGARQHVAFTLPAPSVR
jgi:uncharacterized protein with NRDE domain